MDAVFYGTGVCVWVLAVAYVLLLAKDIAFAFCVAVDWVCWQVAVRRAHRLPTRWLEMPRVLLNRWWYFASNGHEGTTWNGHRGWWSGFGKWGVHPPEGQ
jgi:hypothetical protein